jgi:predicted Zn finger-like uncharacterized protein
MKFLCDQCKAKYQIADEKVAGGKTLKMKCRKCGHIIEIRANSSAPSSVPPPAAAGVGETMQLSALGDDVAAKIAEGALAAPKAPDIKPTAPAAPRPASPTSAAKPATGPAAPRPASTAAKPDASKPLAGASPRPATAAPKPAAKEPEKTGSALASAFNKVATKKVEPEPVVAAPSADPPAEEWYVAVDEVPIGPIRLSELRSKYGAGAVHDDSLVWREGFEEWRPLRTLTDLHRLVKEEVSGANNLPRNSILPAAGAPRTAAPRTNTSPSAKPAPASPTRAAAPAAGSSASAAARGNVIPFARQGGLAARRLDEEDDEETRVAPAFSELAAPAKATDPFAAGATASDPFAAGAPLAAAPLPALANEPPKAIALGASPSTAPEHLAGATPPQETDRRKGGMNPWILGALGLFFGVVIAVVALRSTMQPQVIERVVTQPGTPAPSASAIATATAQPTASATVAASVSASASASVAASDPAKLAVRSTSGGGTPAPSASATISSKLASGLSGPDVPLGPDTSGGGAAAAGGKAKPDGGDWNQCANGRRRSVEKFCYNEGVGSGPASAAVTICVGSDGAVSSTTVESSAPNASFGSCVARQLKSCKLPATSAGGCAKIPFIFGG